ncbi:hypothetical protein ACJX0J_033658, partial [Zea mays]
YVYLRRYSKKNNNFMIKNYLIFLRNKKNCFLKSFYISMHYMFCFVIFHFAMDNLFGSLRARIQTAIGQFWSKKTHGVIFHITVDMYMITFSNIS